MDAITVQFLVGLYFVGVNFPATVEHPVPRSVLLQFLFGIVLWVLAFLRISLLG